MYTINFTTASKIKEQRVIANKTTKEIKVIKKYCNKILKQKVTLFSVANKTSRRNWKIF